MYPRNLEIPAAFYENPIGDIVFIDILNCYDCHIRMPFMLILTLFGFTENKIMNYSKSYEISDKTFSTYRYSQKSGIPKIEKQELTKLL